MPEIQTVLIAAGVAAVFLAIVAAMFSRAGKNAAVQRAQTDDLAARELAFIAEDIKFTSAGAICLILLLLSCLGSLVAFADARTVFQQIASGIAFIGSAIIFGLGAAMGRRRTYRIYRSEQREPH